MQRQKNYKNSKGTQILIPDVSAEPLNATISGNTDLRSSCTLEGCSTMDKAVIGTIHIRANRGQTHGTVCLS